MSLANAELAPRDERPARGRLVERLDMSRPDMQKLAHDGWCVVRGVLTEAQIRQARAGICLDAASLGTGLDPNDPTTWKLALLPKTAHGLCQMEGWGLFRGVCATRVMTEPAWRALFKGEQPISSWDCTGINTPDSQQRAGDGWRDKEVPEVPAWLHTDQANAKTALLHHMQGVVALYDAGQAEHATYLIAPRSGESAQSLRDRYLARYPIDPNDGKQLDLEKREWIKHTSEQMRWFVDNGRVKKPRLKAGDMLIWASGVAHASGPGPLPEGQKAFGMRMSVMVCCVPASLVCDEELRFRQTLLEKGRTSGHRVCEPLKSRKGFGQCIFALKAQPRTNPPEVDHAHTRRLDGFGTHRPGDAVHTGMARMCGGYGTRRGFDQSGAPERAAKRARVE